jgi:phenylalanyl-tRNA synthetase beta chain
MKILLSWLEEFVPLEHGPRQVAQDLTMLGLAVDTVTTEGNETVFELDITTNRPDCLSHYGLARELAALYGKPLVPLSASQNPPPESATPKAGRKDSVVEIKDTDVCRRYSARLIRGVNVGPSPDWLRRRLELTGVRSINNVADATNYILMAYGHPMHAFDLDRLEGGKIIVRRASSGESLKTLDGVERRLTSEDLVIADAKRPVALAGIMGGEASEISSATRNVLLESAWFEPVAVRRTSKRQGMHTEASHRFERGADIGATLAAAGRCIELICELSGGTIDPRAIDAQARPAAPKSIALRRAEIARHLGLEPPHEDVERILSSLGFSPQPKGRAGWKCAVPSHRVDVAREIDLIEEIARHYGYDRFPSRLPGMAEGRPARKAPHAAEDTRLRELCLALGYDETISMAMVSRSAAWGDASPVELSNPLSEEAAVLRTSLVPGLLAALEWNLNRGAQNVRLFEMGSVYGRDTNGFREPARLALAATGDSVEAALGRSAKSFDFLDLKGDVEQLAGIFEIGLPDSLTFDSGELPEYYRPGYRARIRLGEKTVARIGELDTREARGWKFRGPVFIAELFLDALYEKGIRSPRVQKISKFPAVERDFSVLLGEDRRFGEVRKAIESLGIPEIVSVAPVEIFRGAAGSAQGSNIPPGRYSLLVRVTLQSQDATFSEASLGDFSARIIKSLEEMLGAQIRT